MHRVADVIPVHLVGRPRVSDGAAWPPARCSSSRAAAQPPNAITMQAILVGESQPGRTMKKALSNAPSSARLSDQVLQLRRSQIVSVQLG